MKEIIIDVTEDGEIKIETHGFQGKSCLVETEFLKDLLGRETAVILKAAFYEQEKTVVKKYLPLCG